jgi:NDP-sugar pyrophosphorylase family protein
MDTIILCGGKGTRVAEITQNEIPKILIPINGSPFIRYLVHVLMLRGCNHLYFSTGFLGKQIEDHITTLLKEDPFWQHFLFPRFVLEDEPLGTGGAAIWAAQYAYYEDEPPNSKYHEDYVAVINGDTLLLPGGVDRIQFDNEVSTNSTQDYFHCNPDVMMYTGCTNNDGSMGMVDVYGGSDRDYYFPGRITGFREKVAERGEVNLGWYIIRKDLLLSEEVRSCSLEYDLFPKWIKEGKIFEQIEADFVDWFEIGSLDGIDRLTYYLRYME